MILWAVSGEIESQELALLVSYDVNLSVQENENYKEISRLQISEAVTYGTFSVGVDVDTGNYLYSTKTSGDVWFAYNDRIPAETGFIMEYKLWVPADISKTYFVYPCLTALDSNYPTAVIETALNVGPDGIDPYLKNQGTNALYTSEDYGSGADISYGGIAKKGDWNTVSLVVENSCLAMYINGEQALFVKIDSLGVPSAYNFNMYPDGGDGVVPLKIKDVAFSSIVTPAPPLQSVTLSVSKIEVEADESVNITANLSPFNAEAANIAWYVNNALVPSSGLTYVFNTSEVGTYTVHCVIDGIESNKKTITVRAQSGGNVINGGDKNNAGLIAGCVVGGVAVIAVAAAAVVILKKRNAKKTDAENDSEQKD